jgi:hypothetical protein
MRSMSIKNCHYKPLVQTLLIEPKIKYSMSYHQPSFRQERRFTSEKFKLHEKHKPFQTEEVTEK